MVKVSYAMDGLTRLEKTLARASLSLALATIALFCFGSAGRAASAIVFTFFASCALSAAMFVVAFCSPRSPSFKRLAVWAFLGHAVVFAYFFWLLVLSGVPLS